MLLISIILILVLKSFHKGDNRILVLLVLFWGIIISINNFNIGSISLFNDMFIYNYKYALGSLIILVISFLLISWVELPVVFCFMNSVSIIIFHFAINWFTIILALEMFTYTIIGIYFTKSRIKETLFYYFVSGFATGLLLIGVITNKSIFLLLGLLIKAGAAPLHYYSPKLYLKDTDSSVFYLFTLSKSVLILLIPFLSSPFGFLVGICNLGIGLWNAILKSSHFFSMLVYSSISHIGYFFLSGSSNVGLFYIYQTLIVTGITSWCLMEMRDLNLKNVNFNTPLKISLIIILLSNLGIPPFLGFYGKLFILESVSDYWIWFLIVGCSTLSGLFYLDSLRRIITNTNLESQSNYICRHIIFWLILLLPFFTVESFLIQE